MSSMSARDKKILLALVPLVVVLAFWFLLLSPRRAELAKVNTEVSTAQQQRDDAVTKAGSLESARASYARDYATVVRLGKAVPSSVDMPSLLVQLDSAAKGTHIDFTSVKAGTRTENASTAPAAGSSSTTSSSSGSSSSGSGAPPVAAGGTPAQTGPGQATEKANNASATSGQANANAGAGPSGSSTTTSGSSATPTTSSTASGGSAAPGLDSVPLEFTFTGSYFDLADFFHKMKRFVRLANGNVSVKGRLMTIDKVQFDSSTFPKIKASVGATVYLSPKSEGTTAGGTASGPQPTSTPAAGSSTPTPTPTSAGGSAQ